MKTKCLGDVDVYITRYNSQTVEELKRKIREQIDLNNQKGENLTEFSAGDTAVNLAAEALSLNAALISIENNPELTDTYLWDRKNDLIRYYPKFVRGYNNISFEWIYKNKEDLLQAYKDLLRSVTEIPNREKISKGLTVGRIERDIKFLTDNIIMIEKDDGKDSCEEIL